MDKNNKDRLESLNEMQNNHHQITPPPEVDLVIERGIQRAKQEKKRKRTIQGTLLTAAAVFLLLVGMIRVSPTFASALSDIPVFNKLVELVGYDENLKTAMEHDYIYPVDASTIAHGVLVDVEGIVIDGSRMAIFFSITDRGADLDYLTMRSLEIVDEDGKTFSAMHSFWGEYDFADTTTVRDKLEINYSSDTELPEKIFVKMDFGKKRDWNESYFEDTQEHPWILEIELPLKEFAEKMVSYDVQQYVDMEGQRIYFDEVNIHPTQTEILYRFDEENDYEIFGFVDLKLVDENGDVWERPGNTIAFTGEDGRRILYLDSAYFDNEPEELYLQGTRISALPKDQAKIKLDLKTGEIVHGPPEVSLEYFRFRETWLAVEVEIKGIEYEDGHTRGFLSSSVLTEEGEIIETARRSVSSQSGNSMAARVSVHFEEPLEERYVYLPIFNYPNYLEEEWKIKLK
ncbi:MAG: DUF4179 domain-containing protein [Bacillus sp. (in: Bacteria)]|nr:DUF4179 domain-containing protein [Bacillus sp. (in: firmicutes)]